MISHNSTRNIGKRCHLVLLIFILLTGVPLLGASEEGGLIVGGPIPGTISSNGGGGPIPGTISSNGGLIGGGPIPGTIWPSSEGGLIIGGPFNGVLLPGRRK